MNQAPGRIVAIDLLRGFALLGILIMNISSFALPTGSYYNPLSFEPTLLNKIVHGVSHLFADQKFMAIFSMLFGASMILLMEKTEGAGRKFGRFHYARTGWLLLYGLLHFIFLWEGDILLLYAFCGLFLFLLRRVPGKIALVLGLLIFLAPISWEPSLLTDFAGMDDGGRAAVEKWWAPPAEEIEKYLNVLSGAEAPKPTGTAVFMDASDTETASAVARIGADSEGLRKTCASLAPFLDHNPRRIKQLINLLRVRALVSARTGLLDENEFGRFTIQQLGKLVVISLHWPLFMMDLSSQPDLIGRMANKLKQHMALGDAELEQWGNLTETEGPDGMIPPPTLFQPMWDNMSQAEKRWAMEKDLMRLIMHGFYTDGLMVAGDADSWDLEPLNLRPFLEVMPAVRVFSGELGSDDIFDFDPNDIDSYLKTERSREDRSEAAEAAPPEDHESVKS